MGNKVKHILCNNKLNKDETIEKKIQKKNKNKEEIKRSGALITVNNYGLFVQFVFFFGSSELREEVTLFPMISHD